MPPAWPRRAAAGVEIELDASRSRTPARLAGDGATARLDAATAGDDYELLFAARARRARRDILALADEIGLPLVADRRASTPAPGLALTDDGEAVPPARPARLRASRSSLGRKGG